MAITAIIAVITQVLPLIPAIKGLIKGSESAAGSGEGQKKKEAVVAAMTPLFDLLKDKKKLPEDFDVNAIADIVEVIFREMKGSRELKESKPDSNPFAILKEGVAVPIQIQGVLEGTIKPKVDIK